MSNINKLIYSIQFSLFFSISPFVMGDEIPIAGNVMGKRFIDLNEEDLKELRNKSINGDGAAAHRLFIYYIATTKTGVEGFEWLIIAVRNKNPDAIKSFEQLKNDGVINSWINELMNNAKLGQEEGAIGQ